MKYPNAYAGVKKIVAAEALQIIVAGLTFLLALLGTATLAGATAAMEGSDVAAVGALGAGIGVLLCTIGIFVLTIIAAILTLVGLKTASKDERKYFKAAFVCAIVLLITGLLQGLINVIPALNVFSSTLTIISNFCSIAVFAYTVYGIGVLAKDLGRQDMVSLGKTIIIIQVVQILLSCVAAFVSVLELIAPIVSFIGYIIFLVYLTKAKKMLEE